MKLINADKANHYIYGSIIFAIFNIMFTPIIGLLISLIIAIFKEIYDKVSGMGNPEFMDIAYTMFGAIVASSYLLK